jgi:hypothetical protein
VNDEEAYYDALDVSDWSLRQLSVLLYADPASPDFDTLGQSQVRRAAAFAKKIGPACRHLTKLDISSGGTPVTTFDQTAVLLHAFQPVDFSRIQRLTLTMGVRGLFKFHELEPSPEKERPIQPLEFPSLTWLALEGIEFERRVLDLVQAPNITDLYLEIYIDEDNGIAKRTLDTLLEALNRPAFQHLEYIGLDFADPRTLHEQGNLIAGHRAWKWGDIVEGWSRLITVCESRDIFLGWPDNLVDDEEDE